MPEPLPPGQVQPLSGWTTDTLKSYVDQRFGDIEKAVAAGMEAAEKAVQAALASTEKAVAKAEENAERWRASANEWRGAMDDREGRFAMRTEVKSDLESISKELKVMRETSTKEIHSLKESFGRELQGLRESQASALGARTGSLDSRAMFSWIVGIVLAGIVIIGAIVAVTLAVRVP